MIPVTQKKLRRLAINRKSSQSPIWARQRWLLVNTILIIRKETNLRNCTACNPEILSMNFSFVKLIKY